MSVTKKNIISAIFFFLLSVALFIGSYFLHQSTSDALGPQFFPRITGVIVFILSVISLAQNLVKAKKETADVGQEKEVFSAKNIKELKPSFILTILLLVAYVLLLDKIGFVIMTGTYLFCQIILLMPAGYIRHKGPLISTILIAVITPLVLYYLFKNGFEIFLPAGIFG